MPRHDDVALVAAARGGSDAAFARIVDRYQGPLRSFLVRVSGSRADADEIAQEAFLTAWTRLRGLREADRLKSWLFSIAWRKARTRLRSMARSRARDAAWLDMQPDHEAPQGEMALAVRQALAQLPVDQRAALALCLAGGWSHGDAAAILDMPLGTVKSHVGRGRVRLMDLLDAGDSSTGRGE